SSRIATGAGSATAAGSAVGAGETAACLAGEASSAAFVGEPPMASGFLAGAATGFSGGVVSDFSDFSGGCFDATGLADSAFFAGSGAALLMEMETTWLFCTTAKP